MINKKHKEPTGKERMRRRAPSDFNLRPKRFEFDVRKAYSQEQLAEIGAITLAWNQVETSVESLLHIMFMHSPYDWKVWMSLIQAANGLEKKIGILRTRYETSNVFNDEARKAIEITFMGVLENRVFRNGIVHSMIFDHEKGIAHYLDSGKEPQQILVTKDALTGLYERLVLLKDELREVGLLYRMANEKGIVINDNTGVPELDQPKALREQAVPEQTKKLQHYQNIRLSLPPLPEFPDAHLIRPKQDDIEIRLGSEKKGQ